MNATPQFKADPEEYPEIGKIVSAVIRNVVEIMEVHDIGAVRRFRKEGVFDRPYSKDIVTPLGVQGVPRTVAAAREAVGSALLNYLETVGLVGLSITATEEEKVAVGALWAPQHPHPDKQQDQPKDPVLVGTEPKPQEKKQEQPKKHPVPKPAKAGKPLVKEAKDA